MKVTLYVLLSLLITCAFFGFWQRSVLAAFVMLWVFLTVMALFHWHARVVAGASKEMWEEYKKVNNDFREQAEAEEAAGRIEDLIYSWDALQKENPAEFERMWANRKTPAELFRSIDEFIAKQRVAPVNFADPTSPQSKQSAPAEQK
jgi:hypothetical protein